MGLPISLEIIGAAILGIALLAAMWWAYFDVVAIHGETALHSASDEQRPRMARDSYTFLHYPMVSGIILMALGLKKIFERLDEPLHYIALFSLYGGVAVYLLALSAFRLRNVKTLNVQRLTVALGLLALTPAARYLFGPAALLLLCVITLGLIAYELLVFAPLREQVRRGAGE